MNKKEEKKKQKQKYKSLMEQIEILIWFERSNNDDKTTKKNLFSFISNFNSNYTSLALPIMEHHAAYAQAKHTHTHTCLVDSRLCFIYSLNL